jgi:hypothetical protein
MASNNYLPQRPLDPSTYLNPAVNQGTVPPAPPAPPQPLQGQALTATATPPQAPNYPTPAQAQVQQWQQQQQQIPPQPTPEQIQAYKAKRESQQKEANVINNATLGTIGFATAGTGIALSETILPKASDLRQTHVSEVNGTKYHVDLEEKPKGFVERGKGLFGQGNKDKDLQVRRIANGDTNIHIKAYDTNTGKASLVAVDVSDGIQAHYAVGENGEYILQKVVQSRGDRAASHLSLGDLDELRNYDPDKLAKLRNELEMKVAPERKFFGWFNASHQKEWANYHEKVNDLKEKIAPLSIQEDHYKRFNLSPEEIDKLTKAADTIELPDLNAVVKNAHMPRNIDLGEVFQKVLTKGGIGAILGGLAIGGGTWAFQALREKTPEQKRVEAQIAQNKANQLQAGRPPQQGMQQGFPPQQQGMNPAMLAQQGMYPQRF